MQNNRGFLMKNSKYTAEGKAPRYTGTAMINNVKKRISVWINVSKNGNPYMSLSFTDIQNYNKPVTTDIPLEDKILDGARDLDKIAEGEIEQEIDPTTICIDNIPFEE